MTLAAHIKPLVGRFWRATFLDQAHRLLAPANAPRGRWHHTGQNTLYLSGTQDGCRIAIKAYLRPKDPPRGIFPIDVSNAKVLDLRKAETRHACGITRAEMHVYWAELYANGLPSPTWAVSDAARALGVDGLLTPSRSRPDLTHLTLFRWSEAGTGAAGASLCCAGAAVPF